MATTCMEVIPESWTLAELAKPIAVDQEDCSISVESSPSPALLDVSAAFAYPTVPMEATSLQAVLSISTPSLGTAERSALNLVAVIDTSGSMQGQNLRLVVQALMFVVENLSERDALGLVAFDSAVRVVAPLTECSKIGRVRLQECLRKLRAGSQTNLSGGMLRGIQLHSEDVQRGGPELMGTRQVVVRSTFLFTDGMANVGITNSQNLCVAAEAALAQLGELRCTLSTFGFGAGHSGDLLHELAELGHGSYSYVESEDRIAEAFGEALGGLLSTTHQNVQLYLDLVPGALAEKIQTALPVHGPSLSSDGSSRLALDIGDMFAEEQRDILLTLSLPETSLQGSFQIGSLWAKGFSVGAGHFEETAPIACQVDRQVDASANDSIPINSQIELHQNRFIAMEALDKARHLARSGDLASARESLEAAIELLAVSPLTVQGDAASVGLLTDVKRCLADLVDDASYRAKASKAMACASAAHSKQRACGYADSYSTPTCRAMKATFQKHVSFQDGVDDKETCATKALPRIPTRTSHQWKLPAQYEMRSILGQGAYGTVSEAYDRSTQKLVAIKSISHVFEDLDDCKRILREVTLLQQLKHEHVVQMFKVLVEGDPRSFDRIFVVMEICDSDLKKLIRTDVVLETAHVNTILYNLLVGLNYIHSAGVYHRDLKPANCLVNQDCSVKICDFGLARAVGEDHVKPDVPNMDCEVRRMDNETAPIVPSTQRLKRHLTGHVVTKSYRAPELLLLESNYTAAIDIWSAGCIYGELVQMLESTPFHCRGHVFPHGGCLSRIGLPGGRHTHGESDEISAIVQLLGPPSTSEIDLLESEDARHLMRGFLNSGSWAMGAMGMGFAQHLMRDFLHVRDGKGLRAKFPYLELDAADILEQMLQFMPGRRVTACDALEHRLFQDLRDVSKELRAQEPISMALENEKNLDENALREYFCTELQQYCPQDLDATLIG